jgi:hypothetical protein
MAELNINLFKHQGQLCLAPWAYPEIEFFFLIGGYGCGKTSTDAFFMFKLIEKYRGTGIQIGIGGVTITLLRKTLIAEFERYLIMAGIKFTDDRNANMITVDGVTFILVATEQPNLLYAYNFSVFICDELDELPMDKAMEAFTAIQERTRVVLPDGRVPFSVFTTTAQGYAGTYGIIEQLKEIGQPYVKIRGRTIDNTSISKTYYERLYSIYDENERLAFLEGYFVNLKTGRVYSDYNADLHFKRVEPADTVNIVHIGQDINSGFSMGVAVVKRGQQLHVIKEFSFNQIGNAPHVIRSAFPPNEINWFPDASAKEIMAGYSREIMDNDIQLRVGAINPSVLERIFVVNKMFKTDCLLVDKSCKKLDMALKTRQYDDRGEPEKGRGELSPDHICDALEYAVWRIVSSDMTFRKLWELTKTCRDGKKKAA